MMDQKSSPDTESLLSHGLKEIFPDDYYNISLCSIRKYFDEIIAERETKNKE